MMPWFIYFYTLINIQLFAYTMDLNKQESVIPSWTKFKNDFNKKYASKYEEKLREEIYNKTAEIIRQHNANYKAGKVSYEKGINEFSDFTLNEFINVNSLIKTGSGDLKRGSSPIPVTPEYLSSIQKLPEEQIDWKMKGAVGSVRRQGYCSSAWAIVAAELVEGHIFLNTGKLHNVSTQMFLDCLYDGACCEGELMKALEFAKNQQMFETEELYPYQEQRNESQCKETKWRQTNITGYGVIGGGHEELLKRIVSSFGPVSCRMNVTGLKDYKSGLYNDFGECGDDLTSDYHTMLIVGYGTDNTTGKDYWTVKNSWGETWGNKGYFNVTRNAGNTCGIASENWFLPISRPTNY